MQEHVAEKSVLIQLTFRQTQSEVRRVNRHIDFLQDIRQRAQVIFMSVRENDGHNVLPVLLEDIEIRNAHVDAVDTLFGKAHAGIEHEHFVAEPQQSAVHSELADTAEGYDFEDARH